MNTPRSGSLAKECTEESTPERTRKVPIRLSEKAGWQEATSSFGMRRFSVDERRVQQRGATSQGISEAFSTGSQNQKPPQPSS